MKSHIVTFVIGFSTGIILYFFAGKTETIEKPIVTVDSNYYWINASQIDTLKHLRARVDSFQVSARKRSVTIIPQSGSLVVPVVDTPQIASNEPVLYNVFEMDTTISRGMDSVRQYIAFTEYPEPHFNFVYRFNDDHILVKEKVITKVLPPQKKFVTHGFSIGPGVGVLTRQFDLFVGYTFTFNF